MNWKLSFAPLRAACAAVTAHAEQTTLRFGIEAAYPPFESKTPAGQLQGFDVDIGNAVCAKLNMKCVWVENAFDGLIPALQARKFDAINSAMNITSKRRQSIDFTPAIYVVPIVMIAKHGSPLRPDVASLRGKHVGVLQAVAGGFPEGALGQRGRGRRVVPGSGPDLCGSRRGSSRRGRAGSADRAGRFPRQAGRP